MNTKIFSILLVRFCVCAVICCVAINVGCMSNDAIISEIKKCEKAGMSYGYIMSIFGSVHGIVCMPQPKK